MSKNTKLSSHAGPLVNPPPAPKKPIFAQNFVGANVNPIEVLEAECYATHPIFSIPRGKFTQSVFTTTVIEILRHIPTEHSTRLTRGVLNEILSSRTFTFAQSKLNIINDESNDAGLHFFEEIYDNYPDFKNVLIPYLDETHIYFYKPLRQSVAAISTETTNYNSNFNRFFKPIPSTWVSQEMKHSQNLRLLLEMEYPTKQHQHQHNQDDMMVYGGAQQEHHEEQGEEENIVIPTRTTWSPLPFLANEKDEEDTMSYCPRHNSRTTKTSSLESSNNTPTMDKIDGHHDHNEFDNLYQRGGGGGDMIENLNRSDFLVLNKLLEDEEDHPLKDTFFFGGQEEDADLLRKEVPRRQQDDHQHDMALLDDSLKIHHEQKNDHKEEEGTTSRTTRGPTCYPPQKEIFNSISSSTISTRNHVPSSKSSTTSSTTSSTIGTSSTAGIITSAAAWTSLQPLCISCDGISTTRNATVSNCCTSSLSSSESEVNKETPQKIFKEQHQPQGEEPFFLYKQRLQCSGSLLQSMKQTICSQRRIRKEKKNIKLNDTFVDKDVLQELMYCMQDSKKSREKVRQCLLVEQSNNRHCY